MVRVRSSRRGFYHPDQPMQDDLSQRTSSPNTTPGPAAPGAGVVASGGVGIDLGGDLPCVRCGYNLKGLSIRSLCPECATPVRATILSVVDPMAEAFVPLDRPRLIGWGLLLWSGGALVAAFAIWLLRGYELFSGLLIDQHPAGVFLAGISVFGVVLSGIGAVGLVRLHRGSSLWGAIGAGLGVFATFGAAVGVLALHFHDLQSAKRWLDPTDMERLVLRLGIAACVCGAIIGLRSHARKLASRSMVLRTGRVNRQTMLALVGAVLFGAFGDVLSFLCGAQRDSIPVALVDVVLMLHTWIVMLGSLLFTVGLVGVLVDCVRIRRSVLQPPLTLRHVLERGSGGTVEGTR